MRRRAQTAHGLPSSLATRRQASKNNFVGPFGTQCSRILVKLRQRVIGNFFMTRKIFRSLEEACEAVNVDPNSCRGSSRHWVLADVFGDPHGKGDARIHFFEADKGGIVWNWKRSDGEQCAVFFNGEGKSREIKQHIRQEIDRFKLTLSAEHEATRKLARRIYNRSDAITDRAQQTYLQRKRVNPARYVRTITGFRLSTLLPNWNLPFNQVENLLVLPAVSSDDADMPLKLWSLQFISENGTKRFLRQGRMHGCFCPIDGLPAVRSRFCPHIHLVIGEGFATVQSVMQRYTPQPNEQACGVVAFSCHGLVLVAQTLRQRYPNALITILGDVGNGAAQATEASTRANGSVAFPEFSQEQISAFRGVHGKSPTDWNDYYEVIAYV